MIENRIASSSRQVELRLASSVERFLCAEYEVPLIFAIAPDAKPDASEFIRDFSLTGAWCATSRDLVFRDSKFLSQNCSSPQTPGGIGSFRSQVGADEMK